jgi:glycosyltransferase involved in cell wall biosynthesis
MIRVLADASAAFDQGAGVGRYSRNILDRLIPLTPTFRWTLFHAGGSGDPMWDAPNGARTMAYPLSRRRMDQLGSRLGLPLPVRPFTFKQDVVYSPDFVAPPLWRSERIVTIHDLAFLTHPHLTTPGNVEFLTAAVRREVRRGSYFATVSAATRDRVIELLGVESERLRVVRNGVDRRFLEATPLPPGRLDELGVPREFLLMVGTIEPRKNHAGVLRAIERHPDGLPLVIVGRAGWATSDVVEGIRGLSAAGRLVWLDDFGDRELPGLYAASRGVLYPSWTEGFGLPALEALATGRPVVTGNDAVFREVAGSIAHIVDPGDDDALLEAIRAIEVLEEGDEAANTRRQHAAQYGWDQPVTVLREWIQDIAGVSDER